MTLVCRGLDRDQTRVILFSCAAFSSLPYVLECIRISLRST